VQKRKRTTRKYSLYIQVYLTLQKNMTKTKRMITKHTHTKGLGPKNVYIQVLVVSISLEHWALGSYKSGFDSTKVEFTSVTFSRRWQF
jgi:hypothetical protein